MASVVNTGAIDLKKMVSCSMLPQALVAYNDALRVTFYLVTALSCLTVFGSAAIERRSAKKGQQKQVSGAAKDEEKQGEQL